MDSQTVRVVHLNDQPEYQRLIDPATGQSHGTKAGRVHLAPGEHCHEHSTEAREEILVFLQGHGTLQIAGSERHEVGIGTVAYIPPHTRHDVLNTGSEPLVYVFCVTPV